MSTRNLAIDGTKGEWQVRPEVTRSHMKIWKRNNTLEEINRWNKGTLAETLGIQFTAIADDYLEATMAVDQRTHQPYGLLHGGATAALAETLGSVASSLMLDPTDDRWCVGVEINVNHLRSIRSGTVTARVTPIHVGNNIQVWEIRVTGTEGKLTAVSRLTVSVIKKRS
jgi:1,4-dihydroxy-2-naphthoyl-CoA hydrolase